MLDVIKLASVGLRDDIGSQFCFVFFFVQSSTPCGDSPTCKVTAQAEHSDPKGH